MSDPNQELTELLAMLDDPDIAESTKDVIRHGLSELSNGGPKKAYATSLSYLARNDLNAYSEYVYGTKPFPHHREITAILMDDSRSREVIICPPGAAKSTLVSNQFPAFYMGKNPGHNVLFIGATGDSAEKATVAVRDTVEFNPRYHDVFPEAKKNEGKGWTKSALFLANNPDLSNPNPNFFATGAGGPVQGRRAHVIISDDQLDPETVASKKKLQWAKSWTKELLIPRLHPGIEGRVLVILTRWAEDDLASMLVDEMDFRATVMPGLSDEANGAYVDNVLPGQRYRNAPDHELEVLVEKYKSEGFEAEVAYNESFGRYCARKYLHPDKSRSIWPTHMAVEALEKTKEQLGSARFNLVYNGNPAGLSGDVFKRDWFRYYGPGEDVEHIPDDAMYYQSCDVAVSTKDSADYFVIATVAKDKSGNLYIVDVYRDRLEGPDQPKVIAAKHREYPKSIYTLLETNAYQLSLFQSVMKEGIPCKSFRAIKDKESRARSAAAPFEAGKVFINKLALWKTAFEDEFTGFPRAAHDDQVDAISSIFEEIALRPTRPITFTIGFGRD